MLRLSQTTGYAIKSLGFLSESGGSVQTADIARNTAIPGAYLPKIIQALARGGLVVARRGIGGGVTLARPPREISLLQVVEAVEGPEWIGDCLLGLDDCTSMAACPTHTFWQRIRGEIIRELHGTSLDSIIAFRARACAGAGRRSRRSPAGKAGAAGTTANSTRAARKGRGQNRQENPKPRQP